jgi:hypothetical protein
MKTIKLLIRSVIGFLFLAGIAAIVGAFLIAYASFWNKGIIQQWLPKPPEAQQIMPITLRLYGPRFAIRGDRAYFYTVSTGKTGPVTFSVHPYQAGLISQVGPNAVEFSSFDEGHYTITAVVAGDGNQSAVDHIQFENVVVAREEDLRPTEPETPPVHAMNIPTIPTVPMEPPLPTAREMTIGALANVMSQNKPEEQREVANLLYQMVRRLKSGLLAPNADVPLEIEQSVKSAMKERADPWLTFTASVDTIVEEYRRQGKVTTAASQQDVLMEIANTLTTTR